MSTPDSNLDERIRRRAYHLWEADGRPHGRDDEFWERARELIAMEDNPGAGRLPNPAASGKKPLSTEQPVEPIEAVENQGEFPERLTDQGEGRSTPRRRNRKI